MGEYRLWYVKRGEKQQGPFPEPLICRFIVLGRIGEQDMLSLDGHFWRPLDQHPELIASVQAMLYQHVDASDGDVDWREERAKAALRWLDDRKMPDPRGHEPVTVSQEFKNLRQGGDRRQMPETVDQHVYRENRSAFENWIRSRRTAYGRVVLFMAIVSALVIGGVLTLKPVNPVKVGLKFQADCASEPSRGVNWQGCDKSDQLLVGVDLRSAELSGVSFRQSNLKYADLTGANLAQADLAGADLTGVRLGHAVWLDGRVCAADSVGTCR